MNYGAVQGLFRGGLNSTDWRIHPQVVQMIWVRFGTAEVDIIASEDNTHCPLWFSELSKTPVATDAFAHPWPPTLLYAFILLALLQTVLLWCMFALWCVETNHDPFTCFFEAILAFLKHMFKASPRIHTP